jgi:DNA-binding NarL/FixJ family response regulator
MAAAATSPAIRTEAPAASAPRSGERIRILLADDHKILREGLAGLLDEQPDFEVVSEASDGQMALEMARQTRPDVIVMDVSMPRLNGVEATRKIMAEMPEAKVIGLSMHAQEDMADAMRKAGAIGYVTKGAPSESLTAAIRDAARAGARAGRR